MLESVNPRLAQSLTYWGKSDLCEDGVGVPRACGAHPFVITISHVSTPIEVAHMY